MLMLFRSTVLRSLNQTTARHSLVQKQIRYLSRDVSSSSFRSGRVAPTAIRIPGRLSINSSRSQQYRKYSTPMAAPTDTAAEEVANNTGITPESLSQTLKEKLDATHVEIHDISGGCGASFTALIVSPQFQGKAALARHRLVNSALKTEIAAIHAWTPKCLTPEQWAQQQQK